MLLALTALCAILNMAVMVKNRTSRTKQEIDIQENKLEIESLCNRKFMMLMLFSISVHR